MMERDLKYIWHPCSQMKDYEAFPPLIVAKARGSFIELSDGRKIIDAISSWWCKSLGHNHPRLKKAIKEQIKKFEHVILANTTNDIIVSLAEKLAALTPNLNKSFFASDGSSAIEIAMKMSLHARKIQGDDKRTLFVALENSYHGETIGAMSVSDLGLYNQAYSPLLFKTHFVRKIPYVNSMQDALWNNCESYWHAIESQLQLHADKTTAIIIEPIMQGVSGMKMYSQDFLQRLRTWTQKHNIHLIADEIMTGMARTGKMLACDHANITPDFICLGKGLTSGWIPLSVVLTHNNIYNLFYDDYASGKSFLHSHTYSGNALAAAVALETLNIMEEGNICAHVNEMHTVMRNNMLEIATNTGRLKNIRGLGGIIAADLVVELENERKGFEVYKKAMQIGALLRPLGNTIYWLPPLTINTQELMLLKDITERAILSCY